MSKPKMTPVEAETFACDRIETNKATEEPLLDLGDLPLERLPESLRNLGHLRILALGMFAPQLNELLWQWDRNRLPHHLVDLAPLTGLDGLTSLNLSGCEGVKDLTPLTGLHSLTELDLSWCEGVDNLDSLTELHRLTSLDLSLCRGVTDLTPLTELHSLTELDLRGCSGVTDLTPLTGLHSLTVLDLSECSGVTNLPPLTGLHSLIRLDLSGCSGVTNLPQLTGLHRLTSLDLSLCEGVTNLTPLTGLHSLTVLDLSLCRGVTNLTPLTGLHRLTVLHLSWCSGVTDLDPLDGLHSLTELRLSGCFAVHSFEPIEKLMAHLETLRLYGCRFDDLPAHLCGEASYENVAELVRRHYLAQKTQGRGRDDECKLLIVGNGAAGKTSLVRLIRGEPHRDDESSTHAIHLKEWPTKILLEGNDAPVPVRVNIWDFGGQDLYHE
jgi:internalin A